MDLLPKIIEKARVAAVVVVRCRRPARMAKELRKHLPSYDIKVVYDTRSEVDVVVIRAPNRACSPPPLACVLGSDGRRRI